MQLKLLMLFIILGISKQQCLGADTDSKAVTTIVSGRDIDAILQGKVELSADAQQDLILAAIARIEGSSSLAVAAPAPTVAAPAPEGNRKARRAAAQSDQKAQSDTRLKMAQRANCAEWSKILKGSRKAQAVASLGMRGPEISRIETKNTIGGKTGNRRGRKAINDSIVASLICGE